VRTTYAIGQGRLDEAAQWLAAASDDLEWLGSPRSSLTENLLLRLIVDAVRGDASACDDAARRLIESYESAGAEYNRSHRSAEVLGSAGADWLLGRDERLAGAAVRAQAVRNRDEWRTAAHECAVVEAMAALAGGDAAAAVQALREQVPANECTQYYSGSRSRLLLADAYRLLGRMPEAAATLAPWLADVAAGGHVGGAVVAGSRVMDALASAPWGDALGAAEIQRLAGIAALLRGGAGSGGGAAATDGDPSSGVAAADRATPRPAGLSEREWEVLAMLAAGDSNKIIARRLDLSPFTVKRHVANILSKLGVESRGHAAAKFRGFV
jgi:LuxR family maltose regulon positive regulatory protein